MRSMRSMRLLCSEELQDIVSSPRPALCRTPALSQEVAEEYLQQLEAVEFGVER